MSLSKVTPLVSTVQLPLWPQPGQLLYSPPPSARRQQRRIEDSPAASASGSTPSTPSTPTTPKACSHARQFSIQLDLPIRSGSSAGNPMFARSRTARPQSQSWTNRVSTSFFGSPSPGGLRRRAGSVLLPSQPCPLFPVLDVPSTSTPASTGEIHYAPFMAWSKSLQLYLGSQELGGIINGISEVEKGWTDADCLKAKKIIQLHVCDRLKMEIQHFDTPKEIFGYVRKMCLPFSGIEMQKVLVQLATTRLELGAKDVDAATLSPTPRSPSRLMDKAVSSPVRSRPGSGYGIWGELLATMSTSSAPSPLSISSSISSPKSTSSSFCWSPQSAHSPLSSPSSVSSRSMQTSDLQTVKEFNAEFAARIWALREVGSPLTEQAACSLYLGAVERGFEPWRMGMLWMDVGRLGNAIATRDREDNNRGELDKLMAKFESEKNLTVWKKRADVRELLMRAESLGRADDGWLSALAKY